MKLILIFLISISTVLVHAQEKELQQNEYCEDCIYFYNRTQGEYIQVRQREQGGFVFEECEIVNNNLGEPDIYCKDEPMAGVVLNQEKLDHMLKLMSEEVKSGEKDLLVMNLSQTVAVTALITYGNFRLKKKFPHYAPGMKIKDIKDTKIKKRAICNKFLLNGFLPRLSRSYVGIMGIAGIWYGVSKDWFASDELDRERIIQDQFGDAFGGITEVNIEANFSEFKAKLLDLLVTVSQE